MRDLSRRQSLAGSAATAAAVTLSAPRVQYDEVMYVPFGQWVLPTAFRKNVQSILPFPAPVFWNVSIA